MTLDKFIKQEREFMVECLTLIVADLKRDLEIDPKEYTEFGCNEPTIDVRLCIDLTTRGDASWIFRTGLVDFDSYHSEYCSASCIGLDTDPNKLLNELIGEL